MATMAAETSLRYVLNLIAPAHLVAQRRKSPIVDIPDIRYAYQYFCDVKRSTTYARETAGMMFGEEEVGAPMLGVNGTRGVTGNGNGEAMVVDA
jgi:RuvB-like protein 2